MDFKSKNKIMKPNRSFLLFAHGLLALACLTAFSPRAASATTVEGNLKKVFTVKPGGKLVVDADQGSIEVNTTKDPQVQVEVFRKITAGTEAKAQQLLAEHKVEIAQDGGAVTVRATKGNKGSKGFWNFGKLRFEVRYVISVPDKFDLDLNTAGGSIKITDLTGDVKARTGGGNLDLGAIQGPVSAHTSGGSIHVAGCQGNTQIETSGGNIGIGGGEGKLSAETSGGSIQIKSYKGDIAVHTSGGNITSEKIEGNLNASTSGGSISAALTAQPTADCRLETAGGNITVRLAETAALNLNAETSGGSVSTELPVTTTVIGEHRHNELKGKLNGGGKELLLRTGGGSIHLEKL